MIVLTLASLSKYDVLFAASAIIALRMSTYHTFEEMGSSCKVLPPCFTVNQYGFCGSSDELYFDGRWVRSWFLMEILAFQKPHSRHSTSIKSHLGVRGSNQPYKYQHYITLKLQRQHKTPNKIGYPRC